MNKPTITAEIKAELIRLAKEREIKCDLVNMFNMRPRKTDIDGRAAARVEMAIADSEYQEAEKAFTAALTKAGLSPYGYGVTPSSTGFSGSPSSFPL